MQNLQDLLAQIDSLHPDAYDVLYRHLHMEGPTWPLGEIVATGVSLEEYMSDYAADHCEWVEGFVIKMSPSTIGHNNLIKYLSQLFDAYFELKAIGLVILQPFVMRLAEFPNRRREPDLLVVLKTNTNELKSTYMDGPADLCIEIVSEDSVVRDHGDKFNEYEKGGVSEYWIVDPLRKESRFYRLNAEGVYVRQTEDAQGDYRTPMFPGLVLHVPTLWSSPLPGPGAIAKAVQAMLKIMSDEAGE
jgi:Uma2 family endonuclease